jgi:hypothetical protein
MKLVPVERIELPTFGLQNRCSTAELNRHTGTRRYLLDRWSPLNSGPKGQGAPSISELPGRSQCRKRAAAAATKEAATRPPLFNRLQRDVKVGLEPSVSWPVTVPSLHAIRVRPVIPATPGPPTAPGHVVFLGCIGVSGFVRAVGAGVVAVVDSVLRQGRCSQHGSCDGDTT